jgi:hypothetical protein
MTTLACIRALSGTDVFPMSLRQAFALTLKMPEQNRRLMRDHLTLSAEVRAFRMAYRKGFNVLDEVLDLIERHSLSGCYST